MATESIGQIAPTTVSSQTSIGQDDFLKILTTQLSYQDPLKPMDNQQFMAQMAQFAALEQSRQTNDSLQSLLTVQSATQSIGLIGRTVEVSAASGALVGQVTSLRFVDGTPKVTVRTSAGQSLADLSLSNISVVR
jgi:flagellar basal-body rod modification protein FlgD